MLLHLGGCHCQHHEFLDADLSDFRGWLLLGGIACVAENGRRADKESLQALKGNTDTEQIIATSGQR